MADVSGRASFEAFAGKWRARWPEWSLAEVFLPQAQRDVAVAWFALLDELGEAAWSGDEPAPGLAKLAWWQEEVRGWARGARRHPLGDVLQPLAADWQALADALPLLRERGLAARSPDAIHAALRPLGEAMGTIEASLFGAHPQDTPDDVRLHADALVAALVAPYRSPSPPSEAGEGAASVTGARFPRARRLRATLDRLRRDAARHEPPRAPARWRVLLAAWHAARN